MVETIGLEPTSTCFQNRDFALSYVSMDDGIGVEPITCWVRTSCSAKLSYPSMVPKNGIEPITNLYKRFVLPLNYSGNEVVEPIRIELMNPACKAGAFPIKLWSQIKMVGCKNVKSQMSVKEKNQPSYIVIILSLLAVATTFAQ